MSMHTLALDANSQICLNEGVTQSLLRETLDTIIRFSCESVLQFITALKAVRKGTLSKVIALCLQDELASMRSNTRKDGISIDSQEGPEGSSGKEATTDSSVKSLTNASTNKLDSSASNANPSKDAMRPTPSHLACPHADRPGTWALSRRAFSEKVYRNMPAPQPVETPFMLLSREFTSPKWDKVHFSSLKKKPAMSESPVIVRPDTRKYQTASRTDEYQCLSQKK